MIQGGWANWSCASLSGILLCLLISPSRADDGEFDRLINPDTRREALAPEEPQQAPAPAAPLSPSGQPVPDQDLPPEQREHQFIPEELDVSRFPTWEAPQEETDTPPSFWEEIKLRFEGSARVGLGHDTNVFRSDRDRTKDGFFHATADVELLAQFPQGREFILEVSGDSLLHFQHPKANENFVSSFLEYFHPVTSWLDAGLQNTFELSQQNLLDDNGDLFPRGRFGSLDEEPRVYAILRPRLDLATEVGASYRWKDYEENRGVESLDYQELRLDLAATYKISADPRARIKLRYRFRRRDYRQLTARSRDGTRALSNPHLDLNRHQLSLTLFQELEAGWLQARLIVSLGSVYNQDRFENDRSYRQVSAALRMEWWLLPEWTRLDVALRLVGRNFIVRHPTGGGGHLRHRLLDLSVGLWQRLGRDIPLAVWSEASTTVWRSGDPREDYERFVFQGGFEVFW